MRATSRPAIRWLPDELSRQLDEVAELEGRRPSDVIRDALVAYLAGRRAV